MKTRLIPGFAGSLIARALDIYAPRLASYITSPALQALVLALLTSTRDLVKAISDNNPENRLQVTEIIRVFFNVQAIPLAAAVVREKITTITAPRLRRGLTLLSVPVLGAAELLTDDDPNNEAQAEAVLDTFILDPEVQEYIVTDLAVPVLEKVIKDPFILSFVLEAIEKGIEEGAGELADIEVFNRQRTAGLVAEAKERAIVNAA